MTRGSRTDDLIQAVKAKDLKKVRRLAAAGADVNASGENGTTPLHCAACGMPEMIKFLCENGARPGARDAQGLTPLHVAYLRQDVEAVRLLAAFGGDIHDPIPGGRSPIEEARLRQWAPMLDALGFKGPSAAG